MRTLTIAVGLWSGALACGGTHGSGDIQSSNSQDCLAIAERYKFVLADAFSCEPGLANNCSVQVPLVYNLQSSDGGFPQAEGLCWTAYEGYVDPSQAQHLQPLVDAYRS